jgi:hypothetical protein
MICARLRRRRSVEIEVIYFDKKIMFSWLHDLIAIRKTLKI